VIAYRKTESPIHSINHHVYSLAAFHEKPDTGKGLPPERRWFSKRSEGIVASDQIKAGATACRSPGSLIFSEGIYC
jgi:hypothetical protein